MKMPTVLKNILFIGLIVVLCSILLFVFLMGGSDHRTYPSQKANYWVCEAPHFEIDFADQSLGTHIEWNNQSYPVFVALHADYFDVFLQSEDGILREENILLRGTWEYIGDSMKVEINIDNLFDGSYDELIFSPR